ncbi:1-aminocyclopropane-1-carboxylate deaminase [Penicillium ucsense]|uniref:1-aminocyclopropane-1-carboxylate deaminase n=1 Tax=Penicillium ucsense TaxID=2839758 RepID=A0A8J8WCU9_9EURO|nr:1-aminocyclopropane-1-carboxylate deaminase [Penicillium ucsense]KAF7738581.1 1-aminocyclopropane-1-carboxylate deaminase [Penicillium ucsense]
MFSVPDNMQDLRAELFNIGGDGATLTLPSHQLKALWPFLDNIYILRTQKTNPRQLTTSYLRCRLWPAKPYPGAVTDENRKRKRAAHKEIYGCPCKVKFVDDGLLTCVSRTSVDGHNHDFEAIEKKIPSGVRELAAQEVAKGYTPKEVIRILKNPENGNLKALQLAGGSRISAQDAFNASKSKARPHSERSTPLSPAARQNWQVQFFTTSSARNSAEEQLPPPVPPAAQFPEPPPPSNGPTFAVLKPVASGQSTQAAPTRAQTIPPPFSQIPRYPILYSDPSPIHLLPVLSHRITSSKPFPPVESSAPRPPRISIFVKRDDQASPLACTGNKYRKLEYLVPDIFSPAPAYHYYEFHPATEPLPGPATILVTEGALQSNHTVQVAALARKLGLMALVLLNRDTGGGFKTTPSPDTFTQVGNPQINKLLGVDIRISNPDDPKATDAQAVLEELRQSGHRPYWIPGGASRHPLGGLGYARAAFEIANQENEISLGGSGRFDYIFVCCGSGSTVAGLIAGFKLLEKMQLSAGQRPTTNTTFPPRKIVGILNSPTNPQEWHEERVLRFARQAGQLIGLFNPNIEITREDVHLDSRFVGEGYGVIDDETRKTMSIMAETEALILDPVYTAKVATGMLQWTQGQVMANYARQHGLENVNVLFIHTGGQAVLPAYFDQHLAGPIESSQT